MKMNLLLALSFPLGFVKNSLMDLPAHMGLSYFWNFGSFLGIVLMVQIISGFLLSINFVSDSALAFDSIISATRESFFGFVLRWAHLNSGSFFFFLVYAHLFRGLFYLSFRLALPWMSGVTILLLLMGTAFLGYVLPWGQMSLWGATVITNLLTTVPLIGLKLVVWVWGGFSVNTYTLGVFYSFHFLLPFILLALALFHILFLHETGSSSKLMGHSGESKMKFHCSFVIKDVLNLLVFTTFLFFVFTAPFSLGDPENFTLANPLSSPLHIQPEWYFLYAYAILRSVPNKLGGVIALALSVILFYIFPVLGKKKESLLNPHKLVVWGFAFTGLILTWIGGNPVEIPYVVIGQLFTFFYFSLLFALLVLCFSMKSP